MTAARIKLVLLLGGLALGALVFLSWTQTWFAVTLNDGLPLQVGGDVAAPALSTLALTCLVLNGALAIAGPFFRVVLGVLESALGGTIVLSAVLAIADPAGAASPVISDATGIAGAESTAGLVAVISVLAWPWVSAIGGLLLVLLGVAVVATARRWPGAGRKYNAVRLEPTGERSAVDDWDALSSGGDPT